MMAMKKQLIADTFEQMEKLNKNFDHYMWDQTRLNSIREVNKRLKSLNEYMDMFFELHPGYASQEKQV